MQDKDKPFSIFDIFDLANRPVRVVEAVCTCSSCPAQFEGVTDDGRHVYARFRFGHLTLGIGDTLDAAVLDSMDGERTPYGLDEWAGYLSYDHMRALTARRVHWPMECA